MSGLVMRSVPVQAQQGGVILQGVPSGQERVVSQRTDHFARVELRGIPDRGGNIDASYVALKHAVGEQNKSIPWFEGQAGAVVAAVNEHAEGQVDA